MKVYYLISVPRTDVGLAEVNAGYQTLKKLGKWPVRVIKPHRLHETEFEDSDIIWCHTPCEDLSDLFQDESIRKRLLDVIRSGTSMLCTLTAAILPFRLGIEKSPPDVQETGRWRKEAGAYAFRGMMSFDEHPLFNTPNRLRTTFFSWTPQSGEPFWRMIYRQNRPDNVIARGIKFFSAVDDEACCWEYDEMSGTVLCAGAYLYFNARRNYRRPYSEAFLENCIEYLSQKRSRPESKYYWPRRNAVVEQKSLKEDEEFPALAIQYRPQKIFKRPGVPRLKANPGWNFYSCASRRMLLTGFEGQGIAEIWSYPARIFKDVHWSIKPDGKGDIPQSGMPCETEIFPDVVQQQYEYSAYGVREQIGTNIFKPAAYLHFEIVAERDFVFELRFRCDLSLMWPMPEGSCGAIYYEFDEGENLIRFKSEHRGLWSAFGLSNKPESVEITNAGTEAKPEAEVTILFPLMKPGMHYLSMAIVGGDRHLDVPNYDMSLDLDGVMDLDRSADHYRKLSKGMFRAITPDSEINEGTRWAQLKMEAFRAVTPGVGRGLTAGLSTSGDDWMSTRPGYGWYFGRDSLWTGLCLLSVGQWNTVVDSLKLLADYQSIDGKLFHELSTSNYPHYDSADANPLFLILAERYLAWTGDDQTIARIRPVLRSALEFSFNADRDGDCLTENTGVGHGWVEGGKLFGAHVTFYLAGLWLRALVAAQKLFEKDHDRQFRDKIAYTAAKVKEMIRTLFINEEDQTYYYGIWQDKTMMKADTIMPAAVILFGDTDRELDEKFLRRASGPDIVTDWGARMISELDERYNPTAYHTGSVWPLFTGWLGLAQYRRNRPIQGYELLRGGMATYRDFSAGCFSEVLRGDRYNEIGICPQQAWSAGLLLWVLTRGMLGLEPDSEGIITVAPHLPAHWPRAQFRNVRWADGSVDLKYRREGTHITWIIEGLKSGDRFNFAPRFQNGVFVRSVEVNEYKIHPIIDSISGIPQMFVPLVGPPKYVRIDIDVERFISPVPAMRIPEVDKPTTGFRIVDWSYDEKTFRIEVMGLADTRDELVLIDPQELLDTGSRDARRDGERLIMPFTFKRSEGPYSRRAFEFKLK